MISTCGRVNCLKCEAEREYGIQHTGDTMTNQQKYAELLEERTSLGDTMDVIAGERRELQDQMDVIAEQFPNVFYFQVLNKLLYRKHRTSSIELRKFDKC